MTLFNWLLGRKKTGKAESRLSRITQHDRVAGRQAAPGAFSPQTHRRTYKTKAGNPAHVDAAFDGDETAAFLLGLEVACRSSWVEAARWDEGASVMTWKINGKSYEFPADYQFATIFARYGSKGRFFWEQWKGRTGTGEFPLLEAAFPLPGFKG